jgi:hypothetical protein
VWGGNGGFGGGGGAVSDDALISVRGGSDFFGGAGDTGQNKEVGHGGGGGALGGAIFSTAGGSVSVSNSTFFNNFVARGEGGGGSAHKGKDAGGAIFVIDSQTVIENATFSGNQSTGDGGAVVVMGLDTNPKFTLRNTIMATNGPHECFWVYTADTTGSGNNLIMNNLKLSWRGAF